MKRKFMIITSMLGIFALATSEIISSDGIHGDGTRYPGGITGRTGANGGSTCTMCHGGNVNTGKGEITIVTDISDFKYQLGKEYNIIVTIKDSNAVKYGVDFTAIKSGDTTVKGTLIPGEGTKLLNREIVHSAPSASKTFKFKWKAPAVAEGTGAANDITFYVAGNASNGDGKKTGDFIYANNHVVSLEKTNSAISEANALLKDITIYPNPAIDLINVSYKLEKAKIVSIKLIALNGKVITNLLVEKQDAGLQNKLLQLPVDITTGVYLLNIQGEGINLYNKISVIK